MVFLEFKDLEGKESDMRFLVPDMEKLLAQPKFYVIGFFGCKLPTSPVTPQIWALDDKLVAAIPSFAGIFAYITIKKADGQYFNYVLLENFEMVNKWREFRTHDSAVLLSPKYYSEVRINHCVLPCNIMSLLDNPANIRKLDIIRTKYYAYRNGQLAWTAVRTHKTDELFRSIPQFHEPRPFTFASFLGDNAFRFYSEIVSYIGKTTGLPVKLIDIASLTSSTKPRLSDLESILKYKIDFAFTCGISYARYFPNLVALAAPVRVEERYQGRPIYYADLIVKSDSVYHTVEDLKGKVFAINERVSLSGHAMPQYHFHKQGGLEKYFGTIVESASHANSINFVADGKADSAAIDSVVLDMEFSQNPNRKNQLRIIESTEPCTMPPFAASAWVPTNVQRIMTNALVNKFHNENGDVLKANGFSRFVRVSDADYDSVRRVRLYTTKLHPEI